MVRGLPKVTTGDPQVWSQTRDSLHVCMLSRSVVSDSLQPPGPVAHQASLSMKFSRQEYWSGWPLPTPGDLPDPRIEPMSLASPALAYGFFTTSSAKPLRLSQSHPCPGSASLTSLPDPLVSLLPSPGLCLLRFVFLEGAGLCFLPSFIGSFIANLHLSSSCCVPGAGVQREKKHSVSLKAGPV